MTASTANNVLGYLIGERSLLGLSQIGDAIRQSKNYRQELENGDEPKPLLIFETSKQRTWLVATGQRLYCVLDDVRKERPSVRWSMSKKDLLDGDKFILSLKVRPKTENTGLIDFGPSHKDWLFSHKLFSNLSIEESVEMLVAQKMADGELVSQHT